MTCIVMTLCGFGSLKHLERKLHSEQYVIQLYGIWKHGAILFCIGIHPLCDEE